MDLLVLLEVLGAFKTLIADLTRMRLERDMDTEVRGDMVAFGTGRIAVLPKASEREVISRLASDMVVTEVVIQRLCTWI